jgi:hypothetical protein
MEMKMGKLAIKRLTMSDLTLFKWQFDNGASNQKSINLNADVFIDSLYPSLLNTDVGRSGRIPLDLYLYGPGNERSYNLQRKIIKGDSYKNWRLNGEYITNPDENPERFNSLEPNDYVIFDFEGELFPTAARAVFVSSKVEEDVRLHKGITDLGQQRSMRPIERAELHLVAVASGTPESHPVWELLLDSAIEDAALGGIEGTKKILSRRTGGKITRSALERARQRADDVGRMGEELLNAYFAEQKDFGKISSFQWVASENAISPYDFLLEGRKVEVKSTTSDFNQTLHISIAQLHEMKDSNERFDLYRLYCVDGRQGVLRVKEDMKSFAISTLAIFEKLPAGVTVDGISLKPNTLEFGAELKIELQSASITDQ